MRRDGPEGPERPHGRRQPEDEERGFLWPPTAGELALCILLFILFFAFRHPMPDGLFHSCDSRSTPATSRSRRPPGPRRLKRFPYSAAATMPGSVQEDTQ